MPTTCVVGILWGDEGKGKIIDLLARDADYVVRFGGGHNAGHTLVLPSGRLVLHLVPSGIVHPGVVNVIGNGVVVDPLHLLQELAGLRDRGLVVEPGRNLLVSERAHVILELHRVQDRWHEQARGKGRIGTTGRGIGPAYADRCSRIGLRLGDLIRPAALRDGIEALCSEKNLVFRAAGLPAVDPALVFDQLAAAGEALRPALCDTGFVLRAAVREGRRVLLEGAQGCLLDLEHGTYPFVTSSHSSTGGAFSGTGLPPHPLRVIGVAKAYATRVGEGPFPSELHGEIGDRLREAGREFGSTTGRPRRCGWFDAVAVRYAAEVSGAGELVITNLDVLQGFQPLRMVTGYRGPDGRALPGLPAFDLAAVTPEYTEFEGFAAGVRQARSYGALPDGARRYIEAIEARTGLPVRIISVGPGRDEVILR